MLNTKIKLLLKETYVKTNNFLTKKILIKTKQFFRGGLLQAPGFTIPKTNKFQYFIITSWHYIL